MQKYSTVIIDDEALAIDVIKHHLSMFPDYEVIKTFQDPVQAFTFLKKHPVDLVFTDIAMPELSGLELVKLIGDSSKFVMTTSYSEYAIESFELNVVDYLLKPVALTRFSKTIERFEQTITQTSSIEASFFVKDGDEFIKIFINKIDYVEGMKDYAKIVCGNKYHLVLKTLKSLEGFLKVHQFQRIHKSFIVPLNKIIQSNNRCVLIGQHEVPIGPSYRDKLKVFLNQRKI